MVDAEVSALKFLEVEPEQARGHALVVDSAQALRTSLGAEAPVVFVVAEPWKQVLAGFRDVIVHEPSVDYDHWDRVLGKLRAAGATGNVMAVLKTPKRKSSSNFAATVQAIFGEARKLKMARATVILAVPHDMLLELAERHDVRLRQVLRHEDVKTLVQLGGAVVPEAIQAAFPGKSPLAAYVRALATRAMTSPLVLLRGGAGTGKRVLAQGIHAAGSPDGPFEVVRCGAFIDDRDLDRELFGYVRAGVLVPGAWERARGGTLFLHEIADLSPPMQKRIAALLRDGRLARPGASDLLASVADAGAGDTGAGPRLIATTAEPLGEAENSTEAAGPFDDELLFRLLPMSIRVPSLAERGEDFDEVVETAWKRAGGEGALAGDVRAVLRRRLWRGHIRGLKSFLARTLRRFGARPTPEQVETLVREMEPVNRAWGAEVRLPSPAACAAFLAGVRGLLRESSAGLTLLGRQPSLSEAEVKKVIAGEAERLARLGDMLGEPFTFADQTSWRRTRVARDLLLELDDLKANEVVGFWQEKRGQQVFAQAEAAVADTMEWLQGLS